MERKKVLLLGCGEKLREILCAYELQEKVKNDLSTFSAVVVMLPASEEDLRILRIPCRSFPVVVITEDPEEAEEVRMLTLGADDYVKLSPGLVRCRVDKAIQQYERQGRLPESVAKELRHRAEHDELTGIYNQSAFYRTVSQLLQNGTGTQYVLVRWNIERFKLVNDMYGIQAGDDLLCTVAHTLARELPEGSAYGRLSADHFAACVPEHLLRMQSLIERMQEQVETFHVQKAVTISAGAYRIENPALPVDQMCDRANLALQSVKGSYKCHIAWYTEQMWEDMLQEQNILATMEEALHLGQFHMYLQPIYSLSAGKTVAAEALVRWIRPGGEVVGPDAFIPLFEKNGFITELDFYVWEEVCRYLRQREGAGLPPLPISVNISRASLHAPGSCERICEVTRRYGVDPALFRVEITESAYVEDLARIEEATAELRQSGFQVFLDDFGSGYSSLNTLKDLCVDAIKLDTKFLQGFESGGRVGTVLISILCMARWLKLPVIAEGVETQEQVDFLYSAGCDMIQGYCFARPMCAEAFEEWILKPLPQRGSTLPRRINRADFDVLLGGNPVVSRLLDGAFGGVAFCEMHDGRLETLRVNEGFYQIMDCTPKSFARDSEDLWQLVVEEDRQTARDSCMETVRTEKPVRQIVRCNSRNGKELYLDSIYTCLGSDGQRALICITFNDIAHQLKAQQERQEAQQQLIYRDQLAQILLSDSDTLSFDYSIKEDVMVFNFLDRQGNRVSRKIRRYLPFVERSTVIAPEYRSAVRKALEQGRQSSLSGSFELISNYTGKGYRWYKVTFVSIASGEGHPFRIVGKAVDITEQKNLLWQEENSFSHAMETGLMEIATVNLSQGVIETCRSRKRNIRQLVGKPFTCDHFFRYCQKLISEEEPCQAAYEKMNPQALMAAYEQGEHTAQVEFPVLEEHGGMRWMRMDVRLLRNMGTGDLMASYHLWDINEQKISREIVESVARLNYDYLARISIQNGTYELYGVKENAGILPPQAGSYEEDWYKRAAPHLHPEDRMDFMEQMAIDRMVKEIENRDRFSFVYRLMERDGVVRYKRMTISRLDASYLIAARADVTRETEEEMRKNLELRRALEEARKADDAKSQFLARMSREVRAPMDALFGMTELAWQQPQLSEGAREYVKKIQETSEYLRGLVHDILDIYSIRTGTFQLRPQPVGIRELMEQVGLMIKPAMVRCGLLFTIKITQLQQETVEVDRFRLQQALMSILSDVAENTAPGGQVWLSVRQLKKVGTLVHLRFRIRNASRKDGEESFFASETGLGSALAEEIISAMGGTFRGTQAGKSGKCWVVDVPLPPAAPQVQEEAKADVPKFDFCGRRVLLAEDMPLSAEVMQNLLRSRGLAVDWVSNGQKAVERFKKSALGYYDAILMDLRMPNMDGLEATRRIRNLRRSDARRIPVVAVTASAFDSDIRASFQAGMNAHIEKPVEPERLFQTLGALIFSKKVLPKTEKKGNVARLYRMLMTDTHSQVFEYSLDNDIMTYSDFGEDGVQSVRSIPNFSAYLQNSGRFREPETVLRAIAGFENGTGRHELVFQAKLDQSDWRWYSARCRLVKDKKSNRVVGKIEDMDEQMRRTIALRERAEFDPITGLYNRATFQELVENALSSARADSVGAFIEFDLDNFKQVNDTYGHLAGDELLRDVGRAVSSCCRREDIIGRLGGDEFAIWISDVGSGENALAKARRVAEVLRKVREGVSASFGVVTVSGQSTFRELFRKADLAMYAAKRQGKNECSLYQEDPS